MYRLVAFLLLFSLTSFSNNSSAFIGFNEISFEEYKLQKMVEIEINNIFLKPKKRSFFHGTALNELINKFSNTNHISLKIRRSKERENELKISFSKSSLALRYMLD
ncbi:MAG: hypothetical protein CMC36_00385 [Flavobacteriaceae bacterium]|nr:hypothetical protein [Flavobacteriaceae bacterium]|tara:strand:- start:2596 stop:2913 length:318 start_codon:yes stop_codon:yes gene_type:complete